MYLGDKVSQAMLQHWAGVYCVACGFNRRLCSVVQDIFQQIVSFGPDPKERQVSSRTVMAEILIGTLLLPLAVTNLRAPLRRWVSISDASEQGAVRQKLGISGQIWPWVLPLISSKWRHLGTKSC